MARPLGSVTKTYIGKMDSYPKVVRQLFNASVIAGMSVESHRLEAISNGQVQKVKDWIGSRVRNIRIIEANFCEVPYEIMLGVGRFDPARQILSDAGHHDLEEGLSKDHGAAFSTWSYESDRPMSIEAVRQIAKKLPGGIYRCKGVIYAAEAPDQRAVLQVVGRRADVSLFDEWGDRAPHTQIVAIGALGSINTEDLTARFEACILENVTGSML